MLPRGSYTGLLYTIVLAGCAGGHRPQLMPDVGVATPGVLVMAHGGSDAWNASVRAVVAPLAREVPTEIAFGMADPTTLQVAVDRLEAAGVNRIAVIRLFISGDSFLRRTEYLFKKRPHPGPEVVALRISSQVEIDSEGLVDGPEAAAIVRSRALALSRNPADEAVLVIGHGQGDDSANDRLIRGMEATADLIRREGFREVTVETLREDWAEPRADAEARIRGWVVDQSAAGLHVIVIPYRVSGFGPYAEVLEGLDYEADGLGLIPHESIGTWIRRRARTVLCGKDWTQGSLSCPPNVSRGMARAGGRS